MQNRRFPRAAVGVAVPMRQLATLSYTGPTRVKPRPFHAFRRQNTGAQTRSRRAQKPSAGMICGG